MITAVDNQELRQGYLAQMLDEIRHYQQQLALGRYYMKHYHDPAGFDIPMKALGNNLLGTAVRGVADSFLACDPIEGAISLQVMGETTSSTALIYALIFGALSFSFFVGLTSLPEQMTNAVGRLDLPPLAVIAFILLIYIALGCIMDSFAIMVITVPIVTPLILFFGYDILWWGIINLVIVEMSTLTPPFGIHVFVLKALVPDVPIATIFKGILSFVAADIVKIAILVLFPILVLWLPSTMIR